jgi:hypothetical protein
MPRSRKRSGHHEYHKPADIPPSQRTKGRITWAVLFGIFALLIGFFAVGDNYMIVIIAVVLGAAIGYVIGRNMEKEATH